MWEELARTQTESDDCRPLANDRGGSEQMDYSQARPPRPPPCDAPWTAFAGGASTALGWAQVPTTVYTPLEYGACGLSEEAAVEKYGAEGVEVYHTAFRPLEWAVPQRAEPLPLPAAVPRASPPPPPRRAGWAFR